MWKFCSKNNRIRSTLPNFSVKKKFKSRRIWKRMWGGWDRILAVISRDSSSNLKRKTRKSWDKINRGVKWERRAPPQKSQAARVRNLRKIPATGWTPCSSSCSWGRSKLQEKACVQEEKAVILFRKICMSLKGRWLKKYTAMLVILRSNQSWIRKSKICTRVTPLLIIKWNNCLAGLPRVTVLASNKSSAQMSKIHLL